MIELGHKTPKLETFIKIAEVLRTPLDKLLSGNVSWTDKINTYEILEKLNELPSMERQETYTYESLQSSLRLLQIR